MITKEQKRIRKYLWAKKSQTKKRVDRNGDPIEFNLTIACVETLLEKAGITYDDVGSYRGMYCLTRINDIGPYNVENCRYRTNLQNHSEWWDNLTEEQKEEHREAGRVAGAALGG